MAVKIGLTGGIGSGKSTAAAAFAELGVQVLDADRIARQLSAPGGDKFDEILALFGTDMVAADGRMDRKRLAQVVFNNAAKRRCLEAILHPPILAKMAAAAARDRRPYCLLDIPLLVECDLAAAMTRVAVVTCTVATRRQRLRARGLPTAHITQIMRNQASEEARLAVADDVLDNNRDTTALVAQVRQLHKRYLSLFGGLGA